MHCVIVGFGFESVLAAGGSKIIYDYDDIAAEPHAIKARNINPYLVDATDVTLESRRTPICNVPPIVFGSMPNDGGHLLLDDIEKAELLEREPAAKKWIRRFMGAEEFLNAASRWCLWLEHIPPQELVRLPAVRELVAATRAYRLKSRRGATRKLAAFPTLFGEIRQPSTNYVLVPAHSSERRVYIPIGYVSPEIIVGNSCQCIADAPPYCFGVLSSVMHMAWVRTVCGRLESRYRYTNEIVYNNFPWPVDAKDKQKQVIEEAAQDVLDCRATFPDSSLADLYDPLTMPPALLKAHQALDRTVDTAYVPSGGRKNYSSDAERVAFLFELYQKLTSLLPVEKPMRKKPRRK